jgi:excinuclease ABC subunit C
MNDQDMTLPQIREILHQTALKAPEKSGVYLWRSEDQTVIYVGKAKNLKNRLTSYFSGNKDIKTKLLVSRAKSIEYITTENEYEAFLLENNLIKKYSPRYNINLKDGKSYPVIKITKEKFPRLFKTRNVVHDGSLYFGPFPDASALDSFLETLYEIYPLRRCRKFREKSSPCMYYHIGRCIAPCCKKIEASAYSEFIEEIASLLEGKGEETQKKLTAKMKEAASALNFEKAARLRDGLNALSILKKQNIVENFDGKDRDYIASWCEGELVSFTVLKIRGGKMTGRDNFRTETLDDGENLAAQFMASYYTDSALIPAEIFVDETSDAKLMSRFLLEKFGVETKIFSSAEISGSAKIHSASIEMAKQNAREDIIRRIRERGDFPALEELKKILSLKKIPSRIEGFDIAHIGGKFPVASLVSFFNGNPDKKNYRYFRLKTTDGIIDDFASMKEATARRYTRLLNEKRELPDLILIDGGIGQVNAVQSVLDALNLQIPVAGLAKRDEEIFRPGNSVPVHLPKRSDALRLLQRVRDETHRFATSRNQNLRTKENTISVFLKIRNVGEKRAVILSKEFFTLKNLCDSSAEKISVLLKIKIQQAEEILYEAKKILAEENRAKKNQSASLEIPASTKEKSAQYKMNRDLASAALEIDVAETDE